MTNFFSTDEQEEEFRDIPDEVVEGQQAPPAQVKLQRPATPTAPTQPPKQPVQTVEIEEEFEEEVEEDFSEVLSDARLRLEQGRLYELIMNHDLFSGSDADPKAIKYVQKEIRNFAKERMEIMLGMRKETAQVERLEIDFPFNALEVEVLKKLAFTATKGESENSDAYVPEVKKTIEEVPLVSKKVSLNTIGSRRTTPKQTAPLTKKTAPLKRTRRDETVEQILAEEGVTKEELETVFDPNYKPLEKHPELLTPEEVFQRNARLQAKTTKQVRSSSALPMPDLEQVNMMNTQRAQTASAHPQMQTIMNLLTATKKV